MASLFKKAVKTACRLRLAIPGPSGSGKTYTSLRLAKVLGKKIAVIDTERGSASKYAHEFDFDVLELEPPYHPDRFMAAIKAAEAEGYDVCIVDSLSHAWNGQGGILEIVDEEARKTNSGSTFNAWKKGTPLYNKFVDCLLGCRMHLIGTMRSKSEYVVEQNAKGKSAPKKVGTAPVQRDGFEYEFDIIMEMNLENEGNVTKTRCSEINGKLVTRPGEDLAKVIKAWLEDGAPEPQAPAAPSPELKALGNKVATTAMHVLKVYKDDLTPDQPATIAAIKATLAEWHAEDPTCCGLGSDGKPALNACSEDQLKGLEKRFEALGYANGAYKVENLEPTPEPKPEPKKAQARKAAAKETVDNSPPFGSTPEAVGQSDPWGEDDEGRWSTYGDGEIERGSEEPDSE